MLPETLTELAETIRVRIADMLSPARYEHSVRVASLSRELCGRFSLDPAAGYCAGIAHDMAKELPPEELLELARKDGRIISRIEMDKPALLHGRAAAVILHKEYGMEEGLVTNAVRHHTFGDPDLDPLSLVVYVADKIEPGRKQVSPEFRQTVLAGSLLAMSALVLDHTVAYLESRGKMVSDETRIMQEMLAKEM